MKILDPALKPDIILVEEIPLFMKFWNYPYNLNKNMFATIGAPHTWSHL
jgi:hypothetical protein